MEHQLVLYSLLGVALILVAVVVYNNLRARQEAAEGPPALPGPSSEDGASGDALMLKFVRHRGSVVGETVAHDGGTLILKQAGVFKAVPIAQAEVRGDEVVLTGDIDWDEAVAQGTAWQEDKTSGSDPTVSGDLTRSEDVRKPALEALKDKQREAHDAGEDTPSTDEDEGDPSAAAAPAKGDDEAE